MFALSYICIPVSNSLWNITRLIAQSVPNPDAERISHYLLIYMRHKSAFWPNFLSYARCSSTCFRIQNVMKFAVAAVARKILGLHLQKAEQAWVLWVFSYLSLLSSFVIQKIGALFGLTNFPVYVSLVIWMFRQKFVHYVRSFFSFFYHNEFEVILLINTTPWTAWYSLLALCSYNILRKSLTSILYLTNIRLLMMKKNLFELKVMRGWRIMGFEYWRGLMIATPTRSVVCMPQCSLRNPLWEGLWWWALR